MIASVGYPRPKPLDTRAELEVQRAISLRSLKNCVDAGDWYSCFRYALELLDHDLRLKHHVHAPETAEQIEAHPV